MRIRSQLVCASILLAGWVPALLGQKPSAPASTAPPAVDRQPAPARTSGSLPDQTPATPPQVKFQNGLLSIHADNSTLSDVLKAVQNATGASVDSPGVASERVYVNLGPGSARDVLASLLNGSRYDYILLGSQQQPNSVSRVMLTMRQNSREQPATAAASRPAPPPPPAANNDDNDTPEVPPDRSREVIEPQRNPAPPNQQPGYGQPPVPNATGATPQVPGQPANGQVKTPEQMLRDLQQMQQQQQQQLQLQQQLQQQNKFTR